MKNLDVKLEKNIILYSGDKIVTEVTTYNEPEYYLNQIINGNKIDDFLVIDTRYEQVAQINDISIEIKNLYFNYNGEKLQPQRIYFGIQNEYNVNGLAYCHYDNSLIPVYTKEGERLRIANFCNIIAEYDGSKLYDFRKE